MIYFKLFKTNAQNPSLSQNGDVNMFYFKNDNERETIYPRTFLNSINTLTDERKLQVRASNFNYGDGVNATLEVSKKQLEGDIHNLTSDFKILNSFNYCVIFDDLEGLQPYTYYFINSVKINGNKVIFNLYNDVLTTNLEVLQNKRGIRVDRMHQNRFYQVDTDAFEYDFRPNSKLKKNEKYLQGFVNSQYIERIQKIDFEQGAGKDFKSWVLYTVQNGSTFSYFAYPYVGGTVYLKIGENGTPVELDDPSSLFDKGGTQDWKTVSIQTVKYLPCDGSYTITKSGTNYTITTTTASVLNSTVEGYKLLEIVDFCKEKIANFDVFDILGDEDIIFHASDINDNLEPKIYTKDVKKYTYISGSQRLDFSLFDTTTDEIDAISNVSMDLGTYKERINLRGTRYGNQIDCLMSKSRFSGVILKNEVLELPQTTDAYIEFKRNNKNSAITGLAIPLASSVASMGLGIATGGLTAGMAGQQVINQAANIANYACQMDNLRAQPDQIKNSGNDAQFALKYDEVKDYVECWTVENYVQNDFKEYLKSFGYNDGTIHNITTLDTLFTRSVYNYFKTDSDISSKLTNYNGQVAKEISKVLQNGVRFWYVNNETKTKIGQLDQFNNKEKYFLE